MNVYYLAGFGLTCGVAYLVLRHLRFGFWPAAVFALIPFLPSTSPTPSPTSSAARTGTPRSPAWCCSGRCSGERVVLIDPNPPSGPDPVG